MFSAAILTYTLVLWTLWNIINGHSCKFSCMWLNICSYLLQVVSVLSILYIVPHVTSGVCRQGLALLIGTNRVGLGLSQASPQNTISDKSKVMVLPRKLTVILIYHYKI
jgi:hypothetical protein